MTAPRDRADVDCGSSTSTRRVLVTGGSGYLGFRLGTELAKQGINVVLLDIARPAQPLPPGVQFFPGSVADAAAVDAAFTSLPSGSLDAVFHVASYGMSGRELRDRSKILSVNVGGTRNVVSSCLRYSVPRLVYVSTCNVIFVGKPISGGDETAPYPPPAAYKDAYSSTKAQAEKLVLEANGRQLLSNRPQRQQLTLEERQQGQSAAQRSGQSTPSESSGRGEEGCDASTPAGVLEIGRGLKLGRPPEAISRTADSSAAAAAPVTPGRGGRLYTCCIRSTGIWGPGETRHQPRVIRMVRAGLFQATFGDPSSLSDWIHVDNLVQILILAERGLRLQEPESEQQQQQQLVVEGSRQEQPQQLVVEGNGGAGSSGRVNGRADQSAPIAAGQVYYASDGQPINNFLHFKPFIVGLGYCYPSLNAPFALVYGIAWLIEYAWPLLSHFVADPPLTRMEVDKCCIEHWFDISKARRELGYRPVAYDRAEVVRHMAAAGWMAPDARESSGSASKEGRRLLGMNVMMLSTLVMAVVVFLFLAAAYVTGGSAVRQQ